jgi:isoquinoline 1-oxidoreductase beta subunit
MLDLELTPAGATAKINGMGTRRKFILGTLGAGSALVVGWGLLPPRQRLETSDPLPMAAGEHAFGGWLKIDSDDRVHIVMPKSEMGQGVHTGLAMLLADELDADWSRVQITEAPLDGIFNSLAAVTDGLPFRPENDGLLRRGAVWLTAKAMREVGVNLTGGSTSTKDLWEPMRQAGAGARAMLVGAAAQAWGVPATEVQVASGLLRHGSGPGARSARFGEMAAAAAQRPFVDDAPLKTPAQFKLIGQPVARLDSQAKSDGTAVFGLDVRRPGMLYATVRMCPTLGGRVASFDATAALQLPGVKHALAVAGEQGGTAGVAVVADTAWRALKAVKALDITWQDDPATTPAASYSSDQALDAMARQLDTDSGTALQRRGDVQAALQSAARTLEAEYRVPYLAHATLEPQNCTVHITGNQASVWAPTQVPGMARDAVARVLGIPAENVTVHVTYLGGGFGRRLEVDFIAQAAAIARDAAPATAGAPLQTFWSREEDTRHDFYRPAAVARFRAGLDAQGRLTAWQQISAGPTLMPQLMQRHFGLPAGLIALAPDKTAQEGAFDQPYDWPNARVAHVASDSPIPTGFWRAVGHSHQSFFKECFLDEAAHAAGADPLAFRAALLAEHPRALAVLQAAGALAGWGQALPATEDGAAQARGIAFHASFGSWVAQVAQVSLGPDGAIRVHRVACAIDCGTPVNPNLIRQQMEGGVQFGLTMALHEGIDIVRGQVQQGNFDTMPHLRLAQAPPVDCTILPGNTRPEGVGEPVITCIAPAVANAVFALTGQRLRSLPLRLQGQITDKARA